MAKPSVYLETTIISYLAARPSKDVRTLAEQKITLEWWTRARPKVRLFVSPFVVQEASQGDPDAAARRLRYLDEPTSLEIDADPRPLARAISRRALLGPSAAMDCLHVSVATHANMNYLLTWNMKHIGAAHLRRLIESVCSEQGLKSPVICSPAELMEVPDVA